MLHHGERTVRPEQGAITVASLVDVNFPEGLVSQEGREMDRKKEERVNI